MRKVIKYGIALGCCVAAANVYVGARRGIRGCNGGDIQDGQRCDGNGDGADFSVHQRSRRPTSAGKGGRNRSGVASWAAVIFAPLWLCRIVLAGLQWDPSNWSAGIDWIFGGVDSAVRSLIKWAMNVVVSVVNVTINLAVGAIHQVEDAISAAVTSVSDFADSTFATLDHWLSVGVNDLFNWIMTIVHGLINDAEWLLNETISFGQALLNDAISAVKFDLALVENDILAPIASWFSGIEQWWAAHIDTWWNDVYKYGIAPYFAEVDHMWQQFDGIEHEIYNLAYKYEPVLDAAWDWLLLFAANPLKASEQLVRDVTSQGSRAWILGQAEGAGRDVEGWAHDVAQWWAT